MKIGISASFAVLAQTQHADLGRERGRLQAALAQRQVASVATAAATAPDASVDALLESVRALSSPCPLAGIRSMFVRL